ncbi:hypothetical protein DWU99_02100 [Dyella psychrodurans]|uniref:Uncharacterized protein n=1 Tax=Dyella psychrodurans TaxID=1927960 RepID=A0A370XCG2_9GAMM|nr:hypothetical protein DWU99_02100 [Dyella psychrodurans]
MVRRLITRPWHLLALATAHSSLQASPAFLLFRAKLMSCALKTLKFLPLFLTGRGFNKSME